MNKVYIDPAVPGSLGGVAPFYKALRKIHPDTTLKKVKHLAGTIDGYTLHKPRRYKFKRNKFIISDIDDLWQADLADLSALSRFNDGYRYLLIVIDSLSKFVWFEPIRRKDASTTLAAVKNVLKKASPRKPANWLVDKGGEFQNRGLQEYMQNAGINFYYTQSPDTKAAIAERVIRTLKGRIFRYLTATNGWRYIDEMKDIVASYNATTHRTIGKAPKDVTLRDVKAIKLRMYPPTTNVRPVFKFQVGDQVRLARKREMFQKGYHTGWTQEIFLISERLPRNPPVYRVKDVSGEPVVGVFYAEELQKVRKSDNVYKVEKILQERTVNGKPEFLVKWLGYPESMATWEPEDNFNIV